MSSSGMASWAEANQRYLTATLALLGERLRRFIEGGGGSQEPKQAARPLEALEQAVEEARAALPAPSALDQLCAAFGLSRFEREVLLLCAGTELDAQLASLCLTAAGGRRPAPTLSLALAVLPDAHWSAITPDGALRRYRLIEVGDGDTLISSPISISERVLHHLAGIPYLDEQLSALVEPEPPPQTLPPSHQALADAVVSLGSRGEGREARPVIHLAGNDAQGKRAIAARACGTLRIPLFSLRGADVPAVATERDGLSRLWEREARLSGAALLLDCEELDGPGALHPAFAFADRVGGLVLIAAQTPVRLRRPVVRLEAARPRVEEQEVLFREALGSSAQALDGRIEALVSSFHLAADDIRDAAQEALSFVQQGDERALAARLWDACRTKARPRIEGLAQRMVPSVTWDALVLPEAQRTLLRDIVAHVRHRYRVYEGWGMRARGERGLGISALFAGESGTGKTMAAEVLAQELRLDLYRVDLSQVVSKYIGETEKNLRRVFDAADEGGAILLFDEADALFGKRSEVKDSHDRYANIEVSYLLQRMEAYRGLAILTTNMKGALDTAFLRRIRFVVSFPFPDVAHRIEIWRRAFPSNTPTEGLEVQKLARLNVAGGSIHNIALSAAFLAAEAGEPVRMAHLLRAARVECEKLEKPVTEAELGGWISPL